MSQKAPDQRPGDTQHDGDNPPTRVPPRSFATAPTINPKTIQPMICILVSSPDYWRRSILEAITPRAPMTIGLPMALTNQGCERTCSPMVSG